MNFVKSYYFDVKNIPNSACYYTDDKSKLLDDVSFIKKNNYPKSIIVNNYRSKGKITKMNW